MSIRRTLFLSVAILFGAGAGFGLNSGETVQAQGPGYYPRVIARGQDRDWIQSTPMHMRPYRPLHFYGNTVRRSYYRGNNAGNMGRNDVTPRSGRRSRR